MRRSTTYVQRFSGDTVHEKVDQLVRSPEADIAGMTRHLGATTLGSER